MTTQPNQNTPNPSDTVAGPRLPMAEATFRRLLAQIPDDALVGSRRVVAGETNLDAVRRAFVEAGQRPPNQADLDAERARRVEANKPHESDPPAADVKANRNFPGAKGAAEAAKRFGPKVNQGTAQATKRFGNRK